MKLNFTKNIFKIDFKLLLFIVTGIFIFTYETRPLLMYVSKTLYWVYTISITLVLLFSWIFSKLVTKKIYKAELLIPVGFLLFFGFEFILNYYLYGQVYQNDWYMATMLFGIPVFWVIFSLTITYKKDFLKFLYNLLAVNSLLIFVVMLIALMMSGISLPEFFKLLTSVDTYMHVDYANAGNMHNAANFERVFWGAASYSGIIVGNLFVYPSFYFIIFSFVFSKYFKINNFHKICLVAASLVVLIQNSRAMLITTALYAVVTLVKNKNLIKIIMLPVFTLPFSLYLLPKEFLTGRHVLWDAFKEHITLWGNGIGNSTIVVEEAVKAIKKVGGISYHNIHLEFIHNFGLVFYLIFFLLMLFNFLNSKKTTRTFAYLVIYLFYHMSTELNLLEFHTLFPSALLFGLLWLESRDLIKNRKVAVSEREI